MPMMTPSVTPAKPKNKLIGCSETEKPSARLEISSISAASSAALLIPTAFYCAAAPPECVFRIHFARESTRVLRAHRRRAANFLLGRDGASMNRCQWGRGCRRLPRLDQFATYRRAERRGYRAHVPRGPLRSHGDVIDEPRLA